MLEEIKKKFENRDRVIRVLSKNGYFRAVAVKNTVSAQTAQTAHKLEHIPAFFLAKALSSATMISAFLKGEERIIFDISSDGLINRVFAEAMQVGECRGFIRFSDDNQNTNIMTLDDIIGNGTLKISRILYNNVEPITGIVPLQSGDIANDLAYYFAQSEQINAAVVLDVDFNNDGIITSSGGMLVQAMPGAMQDEIDAVVESFSQIDSLCADFDAGNSPEDVLKNYLPFDFDVIKNKQVDFFCRCSKKNFMSKLLLLNMDELIDMQKHKNNELVCQYCSKHYYLDEKDFSDIIGQLMAKRN